MRAAQPNAAPPSGAINLDNILTLIPGEVVPLYIAGSGIAVAGLDRIPGGWRAIVFWVCQPALAASAISDRFTASIIRFSAMP